VRCAAKVLKLKHPKQPFPLPCQPLVRCALKQPWKDKTLTQNKKRINYPATPRKNNSQLAVRTNFTPLLPSCERLRLGPIPRDRLLTGLLWTLCIRKRILCGMTLSARNRLECEIVELHLGGVMAHVVMRVGENLIESVITKRSADEMKLKVGDKVSAVIKSTEVMLEKD
jgi:molybdopterin-binding protein